MSSHISNSNGSERDLLCRGLSAFLLWCVPWCAFAIGFGQAAELRTILWSTSLAVMGVACLLNASRCGRVHCRFTGPFFIFCAVVSLVYGLGLLPLGRSGWSGSASEQSLAPCALLVYRSCFSVDIGKKAPHPNQSIKPTAPLRNTFRVIATTPYRGLSLSR